MGVRQFFRGLFTRRVGIAGVYLGATVLARAGAILLIPLYTRRLTTGEYGDYALAQTLIALLSTPLALGLHSAVARFYFEAKDLKKSIERASSVARWLILITVALSAVLQVGVLVAAPAGSQGIHGRWELSCILWAAAGSGIALIPGQYLRGAQRPFAGAGFQIGEFVLNIGAGLLLVLVLNRGLRGAVEAAALASCINGVMAIVFVGIALKGPLCRQTLREAIKFSLPFVPHALGNQVQFIADRWVMKLTGNDAALGVYALATQLTTPVSMTTQAWNTASTPQIGEVSRNEGAIGVAAHAYRYQRSYVLVTAAAALAVCVGLPVAAFVIGKNFSQALHVIPVICGILILESLYFANAVLVFYVDKPAVIPKITISAGILNVLLNVVFVPLFGIWGAILARSISMGLRSAAMWYAARSFLRQAVPEPQISIA